LEAKLKNQVIEKIQVMLIEIMKRALTHKDVKNEDRSG